MHKAIEYRYNTMTVQSLDTFVNIRGGYHNNLRDVYFLRALGETKNMLEDVDKLDKRLGEASLLNRLLFYRISTLPPITSSEDLGFYSSSCAAWERDKHVSLKTATKNSLFMSVYENAVEKTVQLFREIKPNSNPTIIKNFIIKLLYWTDQILPNVIKNWSEQQCVKFVADNIQREQEFLFFYMTTLIGCDVMILYSHSDANINSKLLALTASFKLGAYGNTGIPKWVRPTPTESKLQTVRSSTTQVPNAQHSPPQVARPRIDTGVLAQHHQTPNPHGTQRTTVNSTIVSSAQDTTTRTRSGKTEKSFEELAQLASSIVMITVIDRDGDPIATGSGIMIDQDGFILTNHHVVKDGGAFAVRIEDDDQVYLTGEVIKTNSQLDLAVIRINKMLNTLPIFDGKTKLVRGQKVVAIGSPLGLFNSVSDGIISGFRSIRDMDMIQFTAPISHGSSGGAVLNMYGEVIGISTAGIDNGQNINLAVGFEDIRIFARGFY